MANESILAVTQFFLALMRAGVVLVSFFFSTLAGAVFLTFVLFLGADISWLDDDTSVVLGSIGFAMSAWFIIAQLAFAPFLLIALVLEITKLSSLLINLLAGGFSALVILVLYQESEFGNQLPYSPKEIWLASIATGFIGGFVHWMIAGHRAGRWIMRNQTTDV